MLIFFGKIKINSVLALFSLLLRKIFQQNSCFQRGHLWQLFLKNWISLKRNGFYATAVGKHRYHCRTQGSRQMPRVDLKWAGRCCLSIVMLGHAYSLSRLSVHHLLKDSRRKLPNEKIFLPTQQIQKNWTALLQRRQKQTSTLADYDALEEHY